MKLKRRSFSRIGLYALSSGIPVWLAMPANAASLYWDGASSGPDADGGLGTWSTAASPANWDSAATAGSDVPWTDGSEAVFGGTGDVVTVSGTVSASSLTFDSPSYRLTGGQVTLTGSPVIAIGGNDVTLETVIAGSGAISKTGTGTLTLAGNNSFTGVFTVSSGTVKAGSGTAFGSSSTGTTVFSGATVDINGKSLGNERLTISGSGVGGAGAIVNYGAPSTTALAYIVLSGPATVGGTARWDLRGGSGGLAMQGHTLTKVGPNDFRIVFSGISQPGNIDVKEGSFWVEGSTMMGGNSTKSVTIRSGAALGVANNEGYGPTWTAAFEANGLWMATGSGVWSGPVTLAGATEFKVDSGSSMTLSGAASGPGSITKTGSNTWILNARNTYTGGTTVNAGTLMLSFSNAGGEGSLRGPVTVNEGGTLRLAKVNALGTLAPWRVSPLNVTGGLVDNTAFASSTAGVINLTGGTLRSNNGVNREAAMSYYTMTDDTVVNALPAAIPSVISGRLHLGTGNWGDISVFNVADGAAAEDLRIDAAITGAGAANGIIKRGNGVLGLHGPAVYTGFTIVDAGTLLLDGTGTLADSHVVVMQGARFGTTVAGKSLANLTVQGGSLILPALTDGAMVVEGTLDLNSGVIAICPVIGADTPAGTYDLIVADSITGSALPYLEFGGAFGSTRATGSVVVNGNKLQLILTGTGEDLVWNNATAAGAADGTWDHALANFSDGIADDTFRAFDAVTFDDSVAPGSAKTIGLGAILAPSRVAVDNSNGDYTLNGTGRLAGAGSLVKTGSGTLTIAGPYSYNMTGPITAGGGVIDFAGKSISASAVVLKSGGALNNATITAGPMDLQSGTANAKLSGSAPWTKTTAGTVTLAADNNLTGPGTIAAGHLVLGNAATPDATGSLGTGAVAISPGAALTMCYGDSAERYVLNSFVGSGGLNFVGSNSGGNSASTFTLTGDNSAFTGPVTVSNARLRLDPGVNAGSGPIALSGRAGLEASDTTVPNALTLTTTGTWGSGSIGNLYLSDATLSGPITLPGGLSTTVFNSSYVASNSTISGPIGEAGGAASVYVKSNHSGNILTLSGASSYTGNTIIAAQSKVILTGSLGATAVTVYGFCTLGGNGVIGNGGSLTFSNWAVFKVATTGGALTVNGNVDLGPLTNIAIEGPAVTGPFPILHYTGTLTGGAAQLAMDSPTSYRKAEFAFTPGLITLDIDSKALVWKGPGSTWDTGTSTCWSTSDAGAATERFYLGDSVVFNDSGPGGYISGPFAVRPSAVVVDNSSKDYSISTGIAGACSVTKYGTGTLSLSSANHTGGTTAHAGRLSISGSGPVTIAAAATLFGDGTINGPVTLAGTLDPGTPTQTWRSILTTGSLVLTGNYRCQIYTDNSDQLAVKGDLDLTGSTLTLVDASPGMPASVVIATYTGTLTGKFIGVDGMPAGHVLKYDTAGKQILVIRATFDEWAATFPGIGSDNTPDGDPDHDGLPSLAEYVLGGNPAFRNPELVPTQTLDPDHLVFRYKRIDASRYNTTQTVQWSPDMIAWTDIPIPWNSSSMVTITSNGDQADDITVTIPRVPGSMFVRLKVAQP